MNDQKVRVRFAPSPTGGLHLGGVRTVLFNYLFAKQQGGDFILRIEDTDQSRFVPGAEEYIFDTLTWCGLVPDESPLHGGPYGPYRQSERKPMYLPYAQQLVEAGQAYYAFDTPEQLDAMRKEYPNFQYNHQFRMKLSNSLTLSKEEVAQKIANGDPYVIRILMPANETVVLHDLIRGEVSFDTAQSDDKVLLKADGMPTYHLAVVVDDFHMKITHAFRGEEWLPSAPIHVLLWKYLFGLDAMPKWAHLPLILKPDGHGKLSKRDGERLGFPVFAKEWKDPATGELTAGFKERGFLPEAFINMLAMLGWNDGTDQEVFSLEELLQRFHLERVHKGGARFDFEKATWFNQEWMKRMSTSALTEKVQPILETALQTKLATEQVIQAVEMTRERCALLNDFTTQAGFLFATPALYDIASIQPKWDEKKQNFFKAFVVELSKVSEWNAPTIEAKFKELAAEQGVKPGDCMLPLRVMLVGGKFGPGVFDIAAFIGAAATKERIEQVMALLG